MLQKFLLLLTTLCLSTAVFAAPPAAADAKTAGGVERGWFFFEDPPAPKEEPAAPPAPPPAFPKELPPPPPKESPCAKKETWTAECGFVNPGTDFQFQAKQRDALMERMTVSQNDPKAVEAVQYYMRWVLERTAEVTNLWWYNMVQNPELDPNVTAPVSAFGLRLMSDVRKGQASEIFKLIKEEGGMFVYFSRHDCAFCHQMTETLVRLSRDTGIPLRNAALDDQCMPAFKEGCMTAPATIPPAQALQVATVPAVFLYVQPNTWLRIGTGVVDLTSLKLRTTQFFSAYRTALLKGVDNSQKGRPAVDFSSINPSAASTGAAGAADGAEVRAPSAQEITDMLGAPRK